MHAPEIVGHLIAWRASDAPQVMELYRRLSIVAPRELTLVAMQRKAPAARWLPKRIHGKPIVVILACYSGSIDVGEAVIAAIRTFGRPVGDVLVRRPGTEMQPLLDAPSWELVDNVDEIRWTN
jgi:hypothetical protein